MEIKDTDSSLVTSQIGLQPDSSASDDSMFDDTAMWRRQAPAQRAVY